METEQPLRRSTRVKNREQQDDDDEDDDYNNNDDHGGDEREEEEEMDEALQTQVDTVVKGVYPWSHGHILRRTPISAFFD